MNKKSLKDKEIEDRLSADIQKMIMDDVKSRGLDVNKFFGNSNAEENNGMINNKLGIKYL